MTLQYYKWKSVDSRIEKVVLTDTVDAIFYELKKQLSTFLLHTFVKTVLRASQTRTTRDGVSFKVNRGRTVAFSSQRQICFSTIIRQSSRSFFDPCRSSAPRVQVFVPLPPSHRFSHLDCRRSANRHLSVVHQLTLRASQISPYPFHVSHLADPRHKPLRRCSHLMCKLSHTPSLRFSRLSSAATDGGGTASPATLDSSVHTGPAGYHPSDDNQRRGACGPIVGLD